jgi:serine/threonine-protein kinase RsbW
MTAQAIALTIPAKAEYLVLTRLVLSGLARSHEIDEESLADLKLAVTEACANAVRHAYEDEPGAIRLVYTVRDGEIDVTVTDDGAGFSLEELPEPAPAGFSEDGMGLSIIRAVTDGFEVEGGPDGSRVRFVKRLT